MTDWKRAYSDYRATDDPIEKQEIYRSVDHSKSQPFEDVYEAAFALHMGGDRDEWFYRGQRRPEWSIVPSLLRDDVTDVELEIKRLSSAVKYLQSRLHVSRDEALAIVQHYSDAPSAFKLRTWLLDVTSLLEVACFFASRNGSDGEVGTIYLFKTYEMERLGSETPKRLGNVDVISPSGVPRIERQSAAFLAHSHPELLEGYLPFNWSFKQYDDVVFEHPPLNITEEDMLAPDDEYLDLLTEWEDDIWPESLNAMEYVTPPHDPLGELEVDDYLAIVKGWLEDMDMPYRSFSEEEQRCIDDLCRIHAKINDSDTILSGVSSEHTLQQTLNLLISFADSEDRPLSFDDVVSRYYHESVTGVENPGEVQKIIQAVRPDYVFEQEWKRPW